MNRDLCCPRHNVLIEQVRRLPLPRPIQDMILGYQDALYAEVIMQEIKLHTNDKLHEAFDQLTNSVFCTCPPPKIPTSIPMASLRIWAAICVVHVPWFTIACPLRIPLEDMTNGQIQRHVMDVVCGYVPETDVVREEGKNGSVLVRIRAQARLEFVPFLPDSWTSDFGWTPILVIVPAHVRTGASHILIQRSG